MPLTVYAIDLGGGMVKKAATGAGYADATETSFAELIGTIIKGVLSFVGVIFMILMVYAGFLWMTARGEDSQIEKAQSIIQSSVIGLVVMLAAYSITSFVVPMILDKTAGNGAGGGSGGGGGGGPSVFCCTVCPEDNIDGNKQDCQLNQVDLEADCQEKYCNNNNVDVECTVTQTTAAQCSGTIHFVNCCYFTNADGVKTGEIMADEAGCDAKAEAYCNQIPACRDGNNVGYRHDYEPGVIESQCQ